MDGNNPNQTSFESETITVSTNTEKANLNIFLSSTSYDLAEYRRRVKEDLDLAKISCYLSEDWINDYDDTLEKCYEEINDAQGYIGIFAYWYGSKPPNMKESVTHWEFQQAIENWKKKQFPPIAVFMPRPLSEAEDVLKQKASALIGGKDEIEREKHELDLINFHEMVKNSWKTVNHFKDQHELCLKVVLKCVGWKGLTPGRAAAGEVDVTEKNNFRTVTDEELGPLGREDQLDDLKTALRQVAPFPIVPAIAFFVSGNEDAGQKLFLPYLVRSKLIKGQPPKIGRPFVEQYDLDLLIQWVGISLGVLNEGQEVKTLEELAVLINAELQNQQMCLILDELHRYLGGVLSFYENFWLKLLAELEKLKEKNKTPNRLIAIFVDYTDKSNNWAAILKKFDGGQIVQADYSKFFLLALTGISETNLYNWFDEMDVLECFPGRLEKLANAVLKNPNGEDDGTPSRVYERLRRQNLWNE